MTTATEKIDPFDTADFAPEKQTLPWLQVLHNEDPDKAGFFLTSDNVETSGIRILSNWRTHKARFKSGETNRATGKFEANTSEGVIFNQARMLVLRPGELSMYTKRLGNNPESYLGRFDYATYQEQKSGLVLKTKYLIYLLSEDNQLLHESPLQFNVKGCFGATFSEHLKAFQSELQRCYGKQRGDKFLINGVFAVSTASELRGQAPDTAFVTVVDSHGVPAKDNWKQEYFVGYDEVLREKLLQEYESFASFNTKNLPQEETEQTFTDPVTGEILPHPGVSVPVASPVEDSEIPY